ncbi:hypothetical protein B0T25DRAFT_554312 [Lasiosphaeria hispida]|uniref:Uncharacterized protein n=1 Tax=Lasiosphaeria hispida TaxID=260671 RepID=A0AAJ0M931_9PEZI|nr:hypothetical protein B0T25DRAFT_554312 [Lasiosphaeria hispida]
MPIRSQMISRNCLRWFMDWIWAYCGLWLPAMTRIHSQSRMSCGLLKEKAATAYHREKRLIHTITSTRFFYTACPNGQSQSIAFNCYPLSRSQSIAVS